MVRSSTSFAICLSESLQLSLPFLTNLFIYILFIYFVSEDSGKQMSWAKARNCRKYTLNRKIHQEIKSLMNKECYYLFCFMTQGRVFCIFFVCY